MPADLLGQGGSERVWIKEDRADRQQARLMRLWMVVPRSWLGSLRFTCRLQRDRERTMVLRPKKPIVKSAAGVGDEVATRARQRRNLQQTLRDIGLYASPRRNDLAPDLRFEVRPLESVRPAERRVRKSAPDQIARTKASISELGFCAPILTDAEGRIIDGHIRWEAARALGMPHLPCIVVSHLNGTEVRKLRLALNRLAERGGWEMAALRAEFMELLDLGEDLLVTGFEMAEVDMVLLDKDGDAAPMEGELPAPPAVSVSRPGDLWILGMHRLIQADARDPAVYARLLQSGEQARIVLTDVPYNVPNLGHVTSGVHHREFAMAGGELSVDEFRAFNLAWMGAAATHLADGGLLGTTIDWRSIDLIIAAGKALGLDLLNLIVWVKSNAGQGSLWRSHHELLPVFKKGDLPHVNNVELGRHGRWRSNVWNYPGASSLGSDAREGLAVHPTVKPREMLEDALMDVTHRGDIVLDCFLGSGSTLLAAEAVGRLCRGIEIDGPYCDVTIERWQNMTGEHARLAETGETFEEVAAQRCEGPGADFDGEGGR